MTPAAKRLILFNTLGQIPSRWHLFGLPQPDYNASKQIGWVTGQLKARHGVDHGKLVWLPEPWSDEVRPINNGHGAVVWSSPDPNEPIPPIVLWLFPFVMASAVLTSASSSPWTVDGTWNAASNTVYLVGAGGNSGTSSQGTSGVGADGGGGGGFNQLANGAVSGTVAFAVGSGGSVSDTFWENTTNSNCYRAGAGGTGTATGTNNGSGGGGGTAGTTGSPAVPFTVVVSRTGGAGGSISTGTSVGGGQGGGAASGPNGAGSRGGLISFSGTANINGGTGGGGADGGGQGGDITAQNQTTHSNGGNGSSGAGGTSSGQAGTGNSGGAGSDQQSTAGTYVRGGNGGSGTDFDASHGLGGGGGGGGRYSAASGSVTIQGGDGGNYGGAGGGPGKAVAGGTVSFVRGAGAGGIIFLTWTASTVVPSIAVPITGPFTMPGGMIKPVGPLVVPPAAAVVLEALRRNPRLTRRELAKLLKW